MEKNIDWNEFEAVGVSNNPQMEYRDITFINDSIGFLFGNKKEESYNKIESLIYSTTDGGRNWKKSFSSNGEGICMRRLNDTLLILQTIHPEDYRDSKHSNIYISNDLGEHWNRKIELPFQLYKIEFITDIYWVGSYRNSIFYTTDAGVTWKEYQLSMPKTDSRLVVITHDGNIIYMSVNKVISDNIETKKSEVLITFSDKEKYYCDGYVYDRQQGGFLIISNSNFTNCQLHSLSDNVIQIPSNNQIGIMSMQICDNNILINGYKVYSDGLSKSVFFYSDNNGSDWVHKDFEMANLPSPVTFYNNEIIAYCFKKNIIIRTSLKKK